MENGQNGVDVPKLVERVKDQGQEKFLIKNFLVESLVLILTVKKLKIVLHILVLYMVIGENGQDGLIAM